MPRDFDLDFDEDMMRPRRSQSSRPSQGSRGQQRPQSARGNAQMQQRPQRDFGNTSSIDKVSDNFGAGRAPSRKKKTPIANIILLIVEIIIFIALIVTFFVLKGKSSDGSSSKKKTESTSESGGSSNGVNVDSNNFTLQCTKVQLANDIDGNPAALIYFTFTNKTDTPVSMSEVYPPSVTQNGVDCPTDAVLSEEPAEVANHDAQISNGQSIECCYAVKLQDFTSTLTLTIHDNYESFSDIGSTEIPLS